MVQHARLLHLDLHHPSAWDYESGLVTVARGKVDSGACRRKDSGNIREVGHGCIRGEERGAVTSELLLSIDNLANYIEEQHTCCR